MYKFILPTLCIALSQLSYAADIVIEEKTLSAPPPTSVPSTPTPPPLVTDNTPTMQWQLYQKVQQLQQELRELNGTIEVQANIIERMKQDARNRYLDLDQRLSELNARTGTLEKNTTATNAATPTTTANTATTTTSPEATVAPDTKPDVTTPPPVNPDADKQAYFAAYQKFKNGGPNKAIDPMRHFIKTYPKSTYISSAYYWLGEFYLGASPADVNNAKKSFKIVVNNYADSSKAPSALLKLASFADVDGKTADAVKYMQRIIKEFPQSEEAKAANIYLGTQQASTPSNTAKAKTLPPPAKVSEKPKNTEKPKKSP